MSSVPGTDSERNNLDPTLAFGVLPVGLFGWKEPSRIMVYYVLCLVYGNQQIWSRVFGFEYPHKTYTS